MASRVAVTMRSRLRQVVARLRGEYYRVRLGWFSSGRIQIGHGLRAFGPLEVRGPGRVVVGDHVTICRDPFHTEKVRLRLLGGGDAEIRIGDGVTLCGSQIAARKRVRVEAGAWVEDGLILDSDFHEARGGSGAGDRNSAPAESAGTLATDPAAAEDIVIGEQAVVGTGALVLRGAMVAKGSIVRPGSVVVRTAT